jgi:hypothetical protein
MEKNYFIIEDTTLTDMAEAIRTKTGSTEKMTPNEMIEAIDGITTGPQEPSYSIDHITAFYAHFEEITTDEGITYTG